MDALYIIGEPGIGKSTLVAALTEGLPFEETEQPFPYRYYDCGVMELGKRREEFSGTDALAMSAQPGVSKFLEGMKPKLLMAEGDRLSNDKFFTHLEQLGYTLHIVYLYGAGLAAARRFGRGSKQDATWLKGRQTKVANLVEKWKLNLYAIQPSLPAAHLVDLLGDPVSARLTEARNALRVLA